MLKKLLDICDKRFLAERNGKPCQNCNYNEYCPNNTHGCGVCLEWIHYPDRVPEGAPPRKYDCTHMADYYTCKYSCRYTSEMVYAFQGMKDIKHMKSIKTLSFGCGPCTDLLALDYLKKAGELNFINLEYRGIDYNPTVWENIHANIKSIQSTGIITQFYYEDICKFIDRIGEGSWIPDIVTFQYFLSDFHKQSNTQGVMDFLHAFSAFSNNYMQPNSYIILNDINLDTSRDGGRDYFDILFRLLTSCECRKGRFCNENSQSSLCPRGYPYGDGDIKYGNIGEFSNNTIFFDHSQWPFYSPHETCASAQMLIKKK